MKKVMLYYSTFYCSVTIGQRWLASSPKATIKRVTSWTQVLKYVSCPVIDSLNLDLVSLSRGWQRSETSARDSNVFSRIYKANQDVGCLSYSA